MNLTVSFSWAGLVVFTLPMLINIAYVLFPPVEKTEPAAVTRWVELVEQGSRMAYLVFPVLYYLCAAIWLHNVPAVITMIIFGAAHITVSLQSFRKEENR